METLRQIIEKTESLSETEQKILIDILRKRLAQKRREEIEKYEASLFEYKNQKLRSGHIDDFLLDIEV